MTYLVNVKITSLNYKPKMLFCFKQGLVRTELKKRLLFFKQKFSTIRVLFYQNIFPFQNFINHPDKFVRA